MGFLFSVKTVVSSKPTTKPNFSYNAVRTVTSEQWDFTTEAAAASCFHAEQDRGLLLDGFHRTVTLFDPQGRVLMTNSNSHPTVPR